MYRTDGSVVAEYAFHAELLVAGSTSEDALVSRLRDRVARASKLFQLGPVENANGAAMVGDQAGLEQRVGYQRNRRTLDAEPGRQKVLGRRDLACHFLVRDQEPAAHSLLDGVQSITDHALHDNMVSDRHIPFHEGVAGG